MLFRMSGVPDPTDLYERLEAFEAKTLAFLDGMVSTLDGIIANQVAKASQASNNDIEVGACSHTRPTSALWVDQQDQVDGIGAR